MSKGNAYLNYTVAQLDEAIGKALSGENYEKGYTDGYEEGQTVGYANGYEVGYRDAKPHTELNYIESTGTQYIDTEIKPKSGYIYEVGFKSTYTPGGSSESWLLSVFDTTVSGYPRMRCGIVGSSYYTDSTNGCSYLGSVGSHSLGRGGVSASNCSLSLYLFSAHEKNGAAHTANSKYRFCFLKMYDSSGNLVNHLVPVLDSNNVACVYDKVTEKYLYNKGTGTFLY